MNKAGALTPSALPDAWARVSRRTHFRFILRHGSVNAVNRSIHPVENCVCLAERNTFAKEGGEGCLCRGGRGWGKVIWILIKLLRWFRWLLKQVCLGADSGYESAKWVWTSFCRVYLREDYDSTYHIYDNRWIRLYFYHFLMKIEIFENPFLRFWLLNYLYFVDFGWLLIAYITLVQILIFFKNLTIDVRRWW